MADCCTREPPTYSSRVLLATNPPIDFTKQINFTNLWHGARVLWLPLTVAFGMLIIIGVVRIVFPRPPRRRSDRRR